MNLFSYYEVLKDKIEIFNEKIYYEYSIISNLQLAHRYIRLYYNYNYHNYEEYKLKKNVTFYWNRNKYKRILIYQNNKVITYDYYELNNFIVYDIHDNPM